MDKKEVAKKYLISATGLYFIGAAVLLLSVFALSKLSGEPLGAVKTAALALLLPLIPLGSYTGFVTAGAKINEIKTSHAALIVIIFPLVLAIITAFGIIFIIPKIIISFTDLIKD